ncbi:integrase arm-type DNA-binding domain-containing protein [Arenimonas sp.]|uniref:tyrosine-type recombinase/integrase n=1 Tax=Arenimonas sp. TaxID=1872635 RepID=UPI0025C24A67|nr:integrase arm-type DNA-binding domain-containing protein [Arenimonas sp.]
MPLHETRVRTARADLKPQKLADERGLYLLVNPGGSKLWRLKYRIGGKEKLLALGGYPDVSLKRARELRDEARQLIARGVDPNAQRREAKAEASGAGTFAAVAEEWIWRQTEAWTAGHKATVRSRLDRDVLPYLGSRRITEIEAPEILQVLRRVEARGAIESAHRIKTVIGQVFAYAIDTGSASRNPARDLGSGALKTPIARPMAAVVKPSEVGALLCSIDNYKGTHVVRCAFKLAPLVFVRPGELRAAEWTEFDLEGKQWVIPAARMKLGKAAKADMNRSHIVPLSRQAVAVLQDVKALTGGGRYVFPGARSDGKPMSENAITAALRRMGYDGDTMTWHGFRSIASTMLNEKGYNADAIEAQLAHTPGNKVRAAYNRAKFLPERTRMMQEWSDHLESLKLISQGNRVP